MAYSTTKKGLQGTTIGFVILKNESAENWIFFIGLQKLWIIQFLETLNQK